MLLIDYFDRGVRLAPDAPCLVSAADGTAYTYREAAELTHRIAAGLHRAGVGPDTPVGVLSPNDPMAFLCVLGALRLNASWVPLNTRARPKELAALLNKTHAAVLFYHERLLPEADEVIAQVPTLRHCIALGDGRTGDAQLTNWLPHEGVRVERPAHEPDRPAVLIGTGGTTGTPKAVSVTHRMLEAMTLAMTTHMPEPGRPVLAVAPPMTHAAGIIVWSTFAQAGSVVIHDGVEPGTLLSSIERDRVTRLFLPPTAIYGLLDHPDVEKFDYSSLRHFIYAAAPMSVERLKQALAVFGPVMCQTFGQAEAPMIATCLTPAEHREALDNPAYRHRLGSVGRASIVADVAIMDDDGNQLPAGEVGEIVVRGALVMPGYFEDDEQSRATRRPGGWHATSDLGYLDADGYLYIVDRKRDMIITGGFNVWSSEIEQVLLGFPQVKDCAVIGLPDSKWGEAVTAVVELRAGESLPPADLKQRCRAELGPVKTPKRVIYRELPRSAVGKVLKRELREEYQS